MAKTTESKDLVTDKKALGHLKSPWKSVPDISSADLINDIIDDFNILAETGWQKPIFIFGAPGIGKTEIVYQVCQILNIGFIPVELRYSQPVDLIGVPKVFEIVGSKHQYGEGVTRANPPMMWPRSNWENGIIPEGKTEEDGPGGIIFFDEFNRADPYVMDSLMQFVQTRTLPGTDYVLPSKWAIVAAGNRPKDDRADKIRDIGSAMCDRFELVNYLPTPEAFLKHVEEYERPIVYGKKLSEIVIPEVYSFIKHMPEYFHGEFDENKDDLGNFTPRGWIDACKKIEGILQQREKKYKKRDITETELKRIFMKEIGYEATIAFMEYYMITQEFSFEDIGKVFTSPDDAPIPGKKGNTFIPNRMWAWICAIVNHAEKREEVISPEQYENFLNYWVRVNAGDYSTAAISMILRSVTYLRKSAAYYDKLAIWNNHYKKTMQD